jgi:hypothetical protein
MELPKQRHSVYATVEEALKKIPPPNLTKNLTSYPFMVSKIYCPLPEKNHESKRQQSLESESKMSTEGDDVGMNSWKIRESMKKRRFSYGGRNNKAFHNSMPQAHKSVKLLKKSIERPYSPFKATQTLPFTNTNRKQKPLNNSFTKST